MDINKILGADVLDIIFEGKNKEYGAYQLRKSYNKRLTKALLLTAAIALLIFLVSVIYNVMGAGKKQSFDVVDTQMAELKKEAPPPVVPPPPPQPAASPRISPHMTFHFRIERSSPTS